MAFTATELVKHIVYDAIHNIVLLLVCAIITSVGCVIPFHFFVRWLFAIVVAFIFAVLLVVFRYFVFQKNKSMYFVLPSFGIAVAGLILFTTLVAIGVSGYLTFSRQYRPTIQPSQIANFTDNSIGFYFVNAKIGEPVYGNSYFSRKGLHFYTYVVPLINSEQPANDTHVDVWLFASDFNGVMEPAFVFDYFNSTFKYRGVTDGFEMGDYNSGLAAVQNAIRRFPNVTSANPVLLRMIDPDFVAESYKNYVPVGIGLGASFFAFHLLLLMISYFLVYWNKIRVKPVLDAHTTLN